MKVWVVTSVETSFLFSNGLTRRAGGVTEARGLGEGDTCSLLRTLRPLRGASGAGVGDEACNHHACEISIIPLLLLQLSDPFRLKLYSKNSSNYVNKAKFPVPR